MSMNTPCNGELQFWTVMRVQMVEQTKQLKRIADALEARNGASFVRVNAKDYGIKLGDMVIWTDPETGEATDGWKVASVPAPLLTVAARFAPRALILTRRRLRWRNQMPKKREWATEYHSQSAI